MVAWDGLRMFLNLDLKLNDLGLLGLLVVVALVMVLSLLENLDLFLKDDVFREKDLMVGLGLGVVEVVSSELDLPTRSAAARSAAVRLLAEDVLGKGGLVVVILVDEA